MMIQKFARNSKGSITTMTALCLTGLFLVTGASIDMMRMSDARTEVYAAMDNAVLAGTQYLAEHKSQTAAAIDVARKHFAADVDGKRFKVNTIDFKVNTKGNGLSAFGDAEIATSFLALAGFKALTIASVNKSELVVAEASSAAPSSDLEISLMLDVTGSMCADGNGPCTSSTKLTALKTAAKQLVDTVIWEDQSKFTAKVAIVPFSTRVRVAPDAAGSSVMKKLTNLEPTFTGWRKECVSGSGTGATSESSGTWTCYTYSTKKYVNWKLMPCVTDRFYNSGWKFELTDTAPGNGYYLNAHDGTRMTDGEDSSSTKPTTGTGKTSSDPTTNWNYSPDGKCYDVGQTNEVMPLTSNRTDLKAKIESLEAYGATSGVLGTAFSWYMLSPEWKTVWTGQSQPKSYSLLKELNPAGKPKLRKIAILMTDGSYNTYRGWKDQDITMVSNNAVAMCTAMKAKGIEIFTVGFALDSLPAAQISTAKSTLKSCGSTINHFYNSINADALKQAFKDISDNVAESHTRLTR